MPLFDNFSKKVGDAAKTAAKKSGELVETTKLNMTINSEEDKIKKLHNEIGKLVYIKFEGGNNFEPDINSICQQIMEVQKNIDSIRRKVLEIKNAKTCPNCKSEMEINIMFCPKCGVKQETIYSDNMGSSSGIEQNSEPSTVQHSFTSPPTEKKCNSCGTTAAAAASFCPICGAKL
jgi:rubrerythrin